MHRRTLLVLALAAAAPLAALLAPPLRPEPAAAADKAAPPSDFDKRVRPFVQKHCASCHNPEKKKADLVLSTAADELAVLKSRSAWQAVVKMVQAGEMPPESRPRPAAADAEAFTRAVRDIFDRADRTGKRDPGHVTIRRLNRAEYNNTIRDLVGVDFQPADDFPSDDVGHGFDNIGDVLSVSPVLMERYLAAAESVAQRAVVLDAPKAPLRPAPTNSLFPRGKERDARVRTLTTKEELYHVYRIDRPGDYTFRVKAYGTPADKEAPKVALFLDGKELATREVTADNERDRTGSYEAKVTLKAGEHRAAVELVNPSAGDKPRAVHVKRFELEGPKDTYPESHKRIMACDKDAPHAEQTQEIIQRFASKAYRRPATKPEVDRLVKLVQQAEKRGDRWEAGIRLAVEAVLCSPKFLFRVELDDRPDSADPHPIDEYQLAARLSYFLWSTMPDDELSDLAGKKQLSANLDGQVKRMLKGPKSKALVDNFAMQWLQLRRLKDFNPDPKLFPTFDDRLRAAMLKETELFFDAVIHEDRSVLDLIDADFTFLNERLASHYGIADTNGNRSGQKPAVPGGERLRGEKFVRVRLQGGERGGLLTQASVLAVTSNPTRTSPVKRGKWVLEQLLGTPPPAPPPNVPQLEDTKRQLTGSLRQRMEQHRADPACANCHARMDPIGFGFENYDAIGAFRAKDEGFAIDPSGTLPGGKTFKGPAELKAILKGKKDLFARCLAEKMFTYALGRGLEYYDRPAVDRICAALAKDDYRFSTLVSEVVKSDPFRLRRGKE